VAARRYFLDSKSVRFFSLEKLINLHDGYRCVFKIDEYQLLLMQESGECYLIEAFCPHRGHSLASATIQDNHLRCPLHGYQFALHDGGTRATSEEPCRALRRYDVVYRDTNVGVML
jgi:nitrite reductase/ring-hydroxylating ferredoxin subunit